MKTALIQAPVWWTIDAPLGPAQIAGALKQRGHEVCALDMNIMLWARSSEAEKVLWNWENFQYWNQPSLVREYIEKNRTFIESELQALLRKGVKAAGFSVNSGNHLVSLELARMLKENSPGLVTMFGGQFFFSPKTAQEWITKPEVDCVFTGAADEALPDFISILETKGRLEAVPGALVKTGGKICDGGPAAPLKDLDRLPFMDLSIFPIDLYSNKLHIPFQSSRGCIWKCRYCSATNFWAGYAQMSGDRIFAELMHHRKQFKDRTHVEFYDLTGNGRIDTLHRLSDLLIEDHRQHGWDNFFGWKINAVIRPEMTPDLLKKMRQAFCKDIIYGIESGSERILRLMNKNYDPETARRVIRDSHEAGMHATANFMFGFPGETEEDFRQSLRFLEDTHQYLDRVYASATFTSLEEGSYLTAHQKEFGIKAPPPECFHNLYWESEDGSNTYPVRMDRYKRFRARAIELGIDAYKGVQGDLEQESVFNVAQYYRYIGRHLEAMEELLKALDIRSTNQAILSELRPYYSDILLLAKACRHCARLRRNPARKAAASIKTEINRLVSAMRDRAEFNESALTVSWMKSDLAPDKLAYIAFRAEQALSRIGKTTVQKPVAISPEKAASRMEFLRACSERNTAANFAECRAGAVLLGTYPQRIFLQMDAPCNADCVFCSRDSDYKTFDFDSYLQHMHPRITPALRAAEEVLFTGSGEFLLLPDAERIVRYFNRYFPHLRKQIATNTSHNNRRLWEMIAAPEGNYTVQVSLHSATPETHREMTCLPSFDDVMRNLRFLAEKHAASGFPRLHLMFVMTAKNIQDLPAFVRLGAELGAEKIIANHAYIYRPEQEPLSLHRDQNLCNRWLAQAYEEAKRLNVHISFPPLFTDAVPETKHQTDVPCTPDMSCVDCKEPWTQIMINSRGDILPCDIYGEFRENIFEKEFMAIWNGDKFRAIREEIRAKRGCLLRCPRHNPYSLADMEALKIHRTEGANDAK